MKKTLLLMGVASALALTACHKGGDADANTQADTTALTDNTINDQAALPDLNGDDAVPGNTDAAAGNVTGNVQ